MELRTLKASAAILAVVKANGMSIDSFQFNIWQSELIRLGYLQIIEYADRDGKYQVNYVLTHKGERYLDKVSIGQEILSQSVPSKIAHI